MTPYPFPSLDKIASIEGLCATTGFVWNEAIGQGDLDGAAFLERWANE